MPRIKVQKPFTVTHQDYSQQEFKPGEHEVDESLAAHWYVKANSETLPDPAAERAMAEEPVAPVTKKKK